MAAEAQRRFGITGLNDAGWELHSTLNLSDQRAAEEAVAWGLDALEKGWEKGSAADSPLQAAMVSLDPSDGSIRAFIGGRDYAASQFDRVSDALRQAGSSFKPIVYAAAFERRVANPASFLEDRPYTVQLASGPWTPQNSDGEYHGWVSARSALERSLNVPTARLAGQVGLDHVVEMSRRLGIRSPLKDYPALALGAMEVTPLELATVYATLAAGGVRTEPHGLVAVFDRHGREVKGQELEPPRRVLGEDVAFLVTQLLQGVINHGTGQGARRDGLKDPLAGKTGTTNSRRDSWFVGYSPERASLVWVGYDDNSTTHLSGSRAALPIWSRFTMAVRPPGGYADFRVPEGVVLAQIDPRTGGLAHFRCSERQPEYFLSDYLPGALCADDDPRWRRRVFAEDESEDDRPWLKRIVSILRGGDAD
jgi:membrane peptidoglycan carboxypeptidase